MTKQISYRSGLLKNLVLTGLLMVLCNCQAPKKVRFEEPVDTGDREISFQSKKSHYLDELGIWVSNEFDGARLNGATQSNDSTVALSILPENLPINKSPYYAFKTWAKEEKTVYFKFEYPEGFRHRYVPKVHWNGKWHVTDSNNIHMIDTVPVLKLQLKTVPKIVAAQEVHTSGDVRSWFMKDIVGSKEYVRVKSAGTSVMGRDIPVLDMYNGTPKNKEIIVLLTRQHPPEVTGYFAFQNFLKAVVSETDLSTQFLSKYRVLAFPIINPDGVDLGHWRHNAHGVDTNRDWAKYRQAEILNVVKFITQAAKVDRGRVILGLDFHSTYEDVFYTNEERNGDQFAQFYRRLVCFVGKKDTGISS